MNNKAKYSSLGFFIQLMILILLAYFACAGIFKDQILKRSELVRSDSTGHVMAEGHQFSNKTAMQVFMMEKGFNKFYPQYKDVSSVIIIVLAAMSLAGMGVLLNEFYDEESSILLINGLLFSSITGIIIWFIGEQVFTANGHNPIFILSLIAGIFTRKFMHGIKIIYQMFMSKRMGN